MQIFVFLHHRTIENKQPDRQCHQYQQYAHANHSGGILRNDPTEKTILRQRNKQNHQCRPEDAQHYTDPRHEAAFFLGSHIAPGIFGSQLRKQCILSFHSNTELLDQFIYVAEFGNDNAYRLIFRFPVLLQFVILVFHTR
ncbi:hypothetical protein D3C72_1844910 [compost metagenome]